MDSNNKLHSTMVWQIKLNYDLSVYQYKMRRFRVEMRFTENTHLLIL